MCKRQLTDHDGMQDGGGRENGEPWRTRTPDLRIRSSLL